MTGATASLAHPYSKISTSEEVRCAGKDSEGASLSAISISWIQGKLFVGLEGIELSTSAFNEIARKFEVSLRHSGQA
jgi:hypothetical protein